MAYDSGAARLAAEAEVFFDVGNPNSNQGDYRVRLRNENQPWRMNFVVPDNFGELISLEAIGFTAPGAQGSGKNIDLFSDYGGPGESFQTHSESNTTDTFDLGANAGDHFSVPIDSVFSQLAAGDRCGVLIDLNGVGGNVFWIGIKLKYKAAGVAP